MNWGVLFLVMAGFIQLLLSVDILGGDIDWDRVTIAFGFFGVALMGFPLAISVLTRREPQP